MSVPWKEHLFDIEQELNIDPIIKFVIFKDKTYRVQGIPIQTGSYICRYVTLILFNFKVNK